MSVSAIAPSALGGVVVADPARASDSIEGRATVLRNRSEQEFAGYRAALDYVMNQPWKRLNVGLVLHLHRELFAQGPVGGGRFRESDNLVVDRSPDGLVSVRFVAPGLLAMPPSMFEAAFGTEYYREPARPDGMVAGWFLDAAENAPPRDGVTPE